MRVREGAPPVTAPRSPEDVARDIVGKISAKVTNHKVAIIADALRSAEAAGARAERERTLDELQADIGAWGDATFPHSTQESVIKHLRDEANNELVPDCDPEEIADVAMLAVQLAHKRGLSLDALLRAKLAKNKARKWAFDPAKGFSTHLREDGSPEAIARGDHREGT
jgi:hypothetical protein